MYKIHSVKIAAPISSPSVKIKNEAFFKKCLTFSILRVVSCKKTSIKAVQNFCESHLDCFSIISSPVTDSCRVHTEYWMNFKKKKNPNQISFDANELWKKVGCAWLCGEGQKIRVQPNQKCHKWHKNGLDS